MNLYLKCEANSIFLSTVLASRTYTYTKFSVQGLHVVIEFERHIQKNDNEHEEDEKNGSNMEW